MSERWENLAGFPPVPSRTTRPRKPRRRDACPSTIHLEKALLSRPDSRGQSPRRAPWTGIRDGFSPSDAPVARATQVHHCPEKEEPCGSCPFQQNDCPSVAQARAPLVIFPGNVETRAPALHSKRGHLWEPFLQLPSANVPLTQTTARSVHLSYFIYSWIVC